MQATFHKLSEILDFEQRNIYIFIYITIVLDMTEKNISEEVRISRWYFGGVASAGAACVTHPLDLLKVQMQTQKGNIKGKNISMLPLIKNILTEQGKV